MKNLDPKVIVVIFIKNFLSNVYILLIWFISVSLLEQVWTKNMGAIPKELVILLLDGAGLIFLTLLVLGCYYWSWLTFLNFTYELQTDGLHIQSGIILRRHIVIPYTDIQTVELLANPLVLSFLQLCSVRIQTRERINTEGVFRKKQIQIIPGLTSEIAGSLRPELLKYSYIQKVKKTSFHL